MLCSTEKVQTNSSTYEGELWDAIVAARGKENSLTHITRDNFGNRKQGTDLNSRKRRFITYGVVKWEERLSLLVAFVQGLDTETTLKEYKSSRKDGLFCRFLQQKAAKKKED